MPRSLELRLPAFTASYTGGVMRRFGGKFSVVSLLAVVLTAAGCQQSANRINLAGVLDINHQPLATGHVATVFIFTTTDCPIANGYVPELNAIISEYQPQGVGFCFVHVDPAIDGASARQHAAEFGIKGAVTLDPKHILVQQVNATVTPEVAVLDAQGCVAYRGRIDDRYTDFGKKRFEPARRDLREALDAIVAKRPVAVPRTKAIGCYIDRSAD